MTPYSRDASKSQLPCGGTKVSVPPRSPHLCQVGTPIRGLRMLVAMSHPFQWRVAKTIHLSGKAVTSAVHREPCMASLKRMSAMRILRKGETRPSTSVVWRKGSLIPPCPTGAVGQELPLSVIPPETRKRRKQAHLVTPDHQYLIVVELGQQGVPEHNSLGPEQAAAMGVDRLGILAIVDLEHPTPSMPARSASARISASRAVSCIGPKSSNRGAMSTGWISKNSSRNGTAARPV